MNIGSLYKVKQYFWLLFPTKEIAAAVAALASAAIPFAATAAVIAAAAAYWSRHSNCEITYFSPDSIVVFLEEDGKYKKILTSDGKIGWIWFAEEYYNDCFEELKAEP